MKQNFVYLHIFINNKYNFLPKNKSAESTSLENLEIIEKALNFILTLDGLEFGENFDVPQTFLNS